MKTALKIIGEAFVETACAYAGFFTGVAIIGVILNKKKKPEEEEFENERV